MHAVLCKENNDTIPFFIPDSFTISLTLSVISIKSYGPFISIFISF